jgi:hypothetical protein
MKRFVSLLLLSGTIVGLGFACLSVIHQSVTIFSLFLWIISLISLYFYLRYTHPVNTHVAQYHTVDILSISLIAILILSSFQIFKTHYHYDETITAYTSWSLPDIFHINWFGVVPEKNEWVSQFPMLFHLLQKPFLMLWPNLLMVRISTWPYTIGTAIIVYLLAYMVFPRYTALLCSICYLFLGTQLYLSSIGLHFHGSTFFAIASMWLFLRTYQTQRFMYGMLLGLCMATSYATYTSSYLVLAIIGLFMGITLLHRKINSPNSVRCILRAYKTTLIFFAVAIAPLIVYASTVNNFFAQRIDQVNIITGSWRAPDEVFQNSSVYSVLLKHTNDALRSLILPNIGGMGEYWFGHQAFFEPYSGILFLLGFCIITGLVFKKKSLLWAIVVVNILCAFVLGLICTTHPPPFHRISIIYPYISLTIGAATYYISRLVHRNTFRVGIVCFMGILYVFLNIQHARNMISADVLLKSNDVLVIQNYITHNLPPHTPIYIAAFPANALGKELLFRTTNTYPMETTYLSALPDRQQNILLLLHRPDSSSIKKVIEKYPQLAPVPNIHLVDYMLFN